MRRRLGALEASLRPLDSETQDDAYGFTIVPRSVSEAQAARNLSGPCPAALRLSSQFSERNLNAMEDAAPARGPAHWTRSARAWARRPAALTM